MPLKVSTESSQLREYVAGEISRRTQGADAKFDLRDAAIGSAMDGIKDVIEKEVKAIVEELDSTRFGTSILQNTRSENLRTKHGALDLIGVIVAEVAQRLDVNLFSSPEEPAENEMCIRYLTAEKWIWLQHQKSIRLSAPSEFLTDPYDSITPTVILRQFLYELCEQPILANLPDDWIQSAVYHWVNEVHKARERYRISCWNIFDEHTSHLMWHQFAGGRTGVAILCPFGTIQCALEQTVTHEVFGEVDLIGEGLVSYDTSSTVEQAFFKRPEYADEREVRFVTVAHEEQDIEIPLHMIVDDMQVISPPDAPAHHVEAIEAGWQALRAVLQE